MFQILFFLFWYESFGYLFPFFPFYFFLFWFSSSCLLVILLLFFVIGLLGVLSLFLCYPFHFYLFACTSYCLLAGWRRPLGCLILGARRRGATLPRAIRVGPREGGGKFGGPSRSLCNMQSNMQIPGVVPDSIMDSRIV